MKNQRRKSDQDRFGLVVTQSSIGRERRLGFASANLALRNGVWDLGTYSMHACSRPTCTWKERREERYLVRLRPAPVCHLCCVFIWYDTMFTIDYETIPILFYHILFYHYGVLLWERTTQKQTFRDRYRAMNATRVRTML